MADHSGGRIDPRFDPAFQRGFDGTPALAPRPVEPVRRQASVAPAHEQISAPPVPEHPAPAPQQAHPVGRSTADEEEEVTPEPEVPSRRPNPFLLGLLAVAAVLVIGGVAVFQSTRDAFLNSEVDFVTMQTVIIAIPILVGLGVATALGVAFVYAVQWKRSHSR